MPGVSQAQVHRVCQSFMEASGRQIPLEFGERKLPPIKTDVQVGHRPANGMIPPGVGPSGWMPSLAAGGTSARSWGVCHSPQVLGPSFSSLFQLRCLHVFSGINPFLDVGGAHSINTRETEASSLQHPWQSHRTPRASARFLPRGQLLRRPWGNLLPTRELHPTPSPGAPRTNCQHFGAHRAGARHCSEHFRDSVLCCSPDPPEQGLSLSLRDARAEAASGYGART